jgi:hypothetical protein
VIDRDLFAEIASRTSDSNCGKTDRSKVKISEIQRILNRGAI